MLMILSRNILYFLYAREQVENIFTPPPFVSFRAGFSLRNHLARGKVYPLLRECGSSGCDKSRCQTCLNVSKQTFFRVLLQRRVKK